MQSSTKRILPADVYDTLEFSALAYGGIGAPNVYTRENGERAAPCCIYGHAAWAEGADHAFTNSPVTRALGAADIGGTDSDHAVFVINARRHRSPPSRISFAEWCAELNVARGK